MVVASLLVYRLALPETRMALPRDLLEVEMVVACAKCSGPITHEGRWFAAVWQLRCPACGTVSPWGYSDKVGLFERYSRPG